MGHLTWGRELGDVKQSRAMLGWSGNSGLVGSPPWRQSRHRNLGYRGKPVTRPLHMFNPIHRLIARLGPISRSDITG